MRWPTSVSSSPRSSSDLAPVLAQALVLDADRGSATGWVARCWRTRQVDVLLDELVIDTLVAQALLGLLDLDLVGVGLVVDLVDVVVVALALLGLPDLELVDVDLVDVVALVEVYVCAQVITS